MRLFLKKRFLFLLICFHLGAFGNYVYHTNFTRPYLTVIGPVNMADGLGRQSVELINYLKNEFPIQFISSRVKARFTGIPDEVLTLLRQRFVRQGRVLILEDQVWTKRRDLTKLLKGKSSPRQIRIAYSMFESTRIPSEWVSRLNSYFDAIAVPDEFLVSVYQESGITIPVFVIPLGLDLSPFQALPLKKERGAPFTFANFSACTPRKNHIQLVRAFAKAFGNDPGVKLRLNYRYQHTKTQRDLADEIKNLGLTNVELSKKSLPLDDYLKLFQEIDCYINVARGEGFSIQPREAMVLGVPVIVTDNTAQTTICKSNLVTAISSDRRLIADEPGYGSIGHNFDFDIDDGAAAMLKVYKNFEALNKQREKTRAWAMQYQYENLLPCYLSLIKPSKIILGERNEVTSDYLMTDSEELYSKYLSLLNE